MKITSDNWTFSHFTSEPLRAFISIGAAPAEDSREIVMQYLVTLTDKDYQELFQSIHETLDEALLLLNEKYGHWDYKEAATRSDGEGCDSCAAH